MNAPDVKDLIRKDRAGQVRKAAWASSGSEHVAEVVPRTFAQRAGARIAANQMQVRAMFSISLFGAAVGSLLPLSHASAYGAGIGLVIGFIFVTLISKKSF